MKTLEQEHIDLLADLGLTEQMLAGARQAQDWAGCKNQAIILGSVFRHLLLNEKQQAAEKAGGVL